MNNGNLKAALLVIDLENGFVMPDSPHQIALAADTLPLCKQVISSSRKAGIPVFFIKRIYRQNGCDVEITRWKEWEKGGKAMTPSSSGFKSAEVPDAVKPLPGDYTIIKPRWSAFFQTELDLILRRLGVKVTILIGTTTPNCIRTTAYDANALDYEVIIVEDCCSSQTIEIQEANVEDLRRMGAIIIDSKTYCEAVPKLPVQELVENIRKNIESNFVEPEPINKIGEGNVGWIDRW